MKKEWALLLFLAVVSFFFKSFFLQNMLPIPSDDLIGLYYPFYSHYATDYPRGYPFKNFLITDPIRQQYPWRDLTVSLEKKWQVPLWNPYTHAGTPLLANIQSGVFYPFNILFFFFPFAWAWSFYIFLGPLLAGIFFYCYVRNLRLHSLAGIIGAIGFSFSGFMVSWMEWGIITHTLLWLPLILLCIDKIVQDETKKNRWSFLLTLSIVCMFFAGHLQMFFYAMLVIFSYGVAQWFQKGCVKLTLLRFVGIFILSVIITGIQWIPAFQFIMFSARGVDQNWQQDGWFIPWQHIIQFIAPDFFGNPTTLNYWGVWNYAEFVGYIGMIPFLFAIFAIISRKDRKTLFFTGVVFVSILFAFPTLLAKLPFIFKVPLISTSQPTRLMGIIDFSLAVLATLGLDYFKKERKNIIYIIAGGVLVVLCLWGVSLLMPHFHPEVMSRASIAEHNLVIPTILFIIFILMVLFTKQKTNHRLFFLIVFFITVLDLLRFANKFTPFTDQAFLYPATPTISYLLSHAGINRVMETDKRIFPPNVSIMYHLQSIDGYDPLYLLSYGQFIAAEERNKPDANPPFGFNRIITPENYRSRLVDLLGVKYVLSLDELKDKKLRKVSSEGTTKIYENLAAYPRIFFVDSIRFAHTDPEALQFLFDTSNNLRHMAIIQSSMPVDVAYNTHTYSSGSLTRLEYSENKLTFDVSNQADGWVVLTDTYYPTWHATVDDQQTIIYRTDYVFRSIFVPRGNHHIVFYDTLF